MYTFVSQYFDNTTEKLELTVTSSDQLLIHHGKKQLVKYMLTSPTSNS